MYSKPLFEYFLNSLGTSFLFGLLSISVVHSRDLSFNIFCTSNKDGTGSCSDLASGQSLNCIIIPGNVIDCKNSLGNSLQCVLINQYNSKQSEFSCNGPSSFSSIPIINPPSSNGLFGNDAFSNDLINVF